MNGEFCNDTLKLIADEGVHALGVSVADGFHQGIGEGDMRILREVGIGSAVGEKEVPSGAVGMDDAQRMLARKGHGFHRFLVDGLPDGVSPDGAQKFCLVIGKGELVGVDLGRLVAFGTLLAWLVGVLVPSTS